MKKNIFTSTLYILAFVGMIITLFVVYKDIDNLFLAKFVFGYLIFLVLFLIYIVTVSIINLRKLNKMDKRKRFFKIIIITILISCCNFIFYYLREPSKISFYNIVLLPFVISLILILSDLPFLAKNKKYY
ncbi:hypothetical protein [Lysinibacillus xylanilyticus]|uniref:hypothetical protein n=1 Tax=Lysinibacillus xylanilyticus TaxID=582475 RepID=UPI003CFC6C41